MKTKQALLCGLIAAALALFLTACLSAPGGARAHTHQWGGWTQVSGDDAAEERACKADSAHRQTRLTGTDRFTFEKIGETAYRISAGTLKTGEIIIPAYYRPDEKSGYLPVTEISNAYDEYMAGAFSYAGISSVYISEGITSISDYAFEECTSLASVIIPESVKSIGYRAFTGCTSLASVTIPESVRSIGYSAFQGCTSLASITFSEGVSIRPYAFHGTAWFNDQPDGLIYTDKVLYTYKGTMPDNTVINNIRADTIAIAESAFYGCDNLTDIIIPTSVRSIGDRAFEDCTSLASVTIPESVRSIGDSAFNYCTSLPSITIPTGVRSIGNYAFVFCESLTSAAIPAGVRSIGINPFARCTNFTDITVAANNPNYSSEGGLLYNKTKTSLIAVPGAISGNVMLHKGIKTIDTSAFSGCTSLTGITIPTGVRSIGERAFIGCTSLTDITIPAGVTSIGESTFSECTSLTGITIPAGVTSIDSSAFDGCKSLPSIMVDDANQNYASEGGILYNKAKTEIVAVPRGISGAVTIPTGVTSIRSAFSNCTSLTTIIIPAGVTSIGSDAFRGCTSLTTVTIPASVTSIDVGAFSGCTSLTDITIPVGVTSIGQSAFRDCTSLTGITIPASVRSIDNSAFSNCTSLISITIPASVTSIDGFAFYGCTSLASITIPASVRSIGERAFYNTAWLNRQPDGLVYAGKVLHSYKGAMPANTVINNIREDTIAIADSAFNEYTNLIRITIPGSVTSLGRSAFRSCTSLASITIPASVTSIGWNAFSRWTNKQTINIEGHASEASADAAWNTGFFSNWRDGCNATINYLGK